jgi:hypothetical protein
VTERVSARQENPMIVDTISGRKKAAVRFVNNRDLMMSPPLAI